MVVAVYVDLHGGVNASLYKRSIHAMAEIHHQRKLDSIGTSWSGVHIVPRPAQTLCTSMPMLVNFKLHICTSR